MQPAEVRRGTLLGAAAYLIWGVFPLYFHLLSPATPLEILAYRILWSLVFCGLVLVATRDLRWLPALWPQRRILVGLTIAALAIAVNWGTYVTAVLAGRTNEAALGYFLNPVITVALGVLVLGEPLRRLQAVAVGIGALAAAYLTIVGGALPVVPLTLAVSFALYGLIKKRVGANLPALHGLTVETAILAPVAVVLLGPLAGLSGPTAGFVSPGHAGLVLATGPITAIPLLLFAAAARRVPLVTIGLLQFLTPVMQLACGLLLGERVEAARWVGFALVWCALIVLTVDSWRHRR